MYIGVVDLDSGMTGMYTGSELALVGYSNLTDADKLVYIKRASVEIDSYEYNSTTEIPLSVLSGAIVDIVYQSLKDVKSKRKSLIDEGVKSITAGSISETYRETCNDEKYKGIIKKHLGKYFWTGVLGD